MVLEWVSAGLAAAGVAMSLRWWQRRVDPIVRPVPYPVSSLVLLELAVAALVPVLHLVGEEHQLSRVASRLAGARATVTCQPLSEELLDATNDLGHVDGVGGVPGHRALIKRDQCRALESYIRGGYARPSDTEVEAVHVLTHESMHMRGIAAEAEAECAAVQRDAETAVLLGATRQEGRALAARYWVIDYPRMPDLYRTTACRQGGELDERLGNGPWGADPTG